MNGLFKKIIYQTLPSGSEWLEHLEVLGAARLSSGGRLKTIAEYYSTNLDGYVCTGIKKDSEEYAKAISLLESVKIDWRFLIPNELLDGYYRLAIRNESMIEELVFTHGMLRIPLNDEQKGAIRQIWKMYAKDAEQEKRVIDKFVELWDSFDTLKALRIWWDAIPQVFYITQVGRVLAQTNAKRCDSTLPDLVL